MERVITYTILPEEDGRLVLDILRGRLGLSATLVKKVKYRERGILCNGLAIRTDQRVRAGDELAVRVEERQACSAQIVPACGTLDIVYEDEDLVVVNKPADMVVHPSPGHRADSLGNVLLWHYLQRGETIVFHPVHRLDRGTSGLMVVAKHAHAQALLTKQMHTGAFSRRYRAIVCGRMPLGCGTICAPIARVPDQVLLRHVDSEGARAVTHYRVCQCTERQSLLDLQLQTGRTHQIRVHMAYLGHPLLGDFLYGKEEACIRRPALHAMELRLVQPLTHEWLTFTAPLPADMQRCLE